MEYRELHKIFCEHERGMPKEHLTAYITFSPESFAPGTKYNKRERTYVVSSNNKAFQQNMGGCSIFGSCLDKKSDPCIRLDRYIAEEHGVKNGWVVEDCCLVGYLLTSANERDLLQPELFYFREAAVETMLREFCENGGYDYEDVQTLFNRHQGEVVDSSYGTTNLSAWLNDSATGNWDWLIRTACIYEPINIVIGGIQKEVQNNG